MAQMRAIVDKLLTNVSNGNFADEEGYLCERIFPELSVKQDSGLLAKYGTKHLSIEHSLIGGRGAARRVESIARSTTSYLLEKHALEGMVTQSDYDNVEAPYDAEKDETIGVSTLILQGKEFALASALTSTSIMTNYATLSGSDQLSNPSTSSPIGLTQTAKASGKSLAGVIFNTLICSWEVMNYLGYHPELLSTLGFNYARPGGLSDEEVAKALKLTNVYVANSSYESAKEGQTSSLAPIWGKHMIFCYLPDSAKPYQKSLGYYVKKQGVGSRKVYKYPFNNPAGSTGVLVEDHYQYLLSDVNCGYLYRSAVA